MDLCFLCKLLMYKGLYSRGISKEYMAKKPEKVSLGWYVPTEARRLFVEFCSDVGTVAQEDCAGAMFIWQYLPAQIREQAKRQTKGVSAIDEEFWVQFQAGLDLALRALQDNPPETPDE